MLRPRTGAFRPNRLRWWYPLYAPTRTLALHSGFPNTLELLIICAA
jgi:hypothetical protein